MKALIVAFVELNILMMFLFYFQKQYIDDVDGNIVYA